MVSSDGVPHSGCLIVRAKSAGRIPRNSVTQRWWSAVSSSSDIAIGARTSGVFAQSFSS